MIKASAGKPAEVPEHSGVPGRRYYLTGGILAGLVLLAVWIPTYPPRPLLPTDDIYTHLSVARHLVRGEGFRTDVTYPLSFAFPFARELPQPLIHRQPGFALLLTAPYLAAGGNPHRTVDRVRWMQIILLGLLAMIGSAVFLGRGHPAAVIPWLILLFTNPLLVFAVDWGMVELVCSLLMLILWLRARGPGRTAPGGIDGLLAGMLCMLRLDLFWVPLLWWILPRARRGFHLPAPGPDRRRLGLLILAWLLVITPWAIRNTRLTGQPAFSLQAFAEQAKDTRTWPGYSVYRQLEPQPFLRTMTTDPVPVLRKAARGMRFFYRDLPRLAPLPVLIILVVGALAFLVVGLKILPARPGRREPNPQISLSATSQTGPAALAVLTVVLLTIQYSFFDHSLRHLLVVLPVMLWESSLWIGDPIRRIIRGRRETSGPGLPLVRDLGAVIILPAAATLLLVLLFPCRLPGWESAAREAVNRAPGIQRQIDSARLAPAGVLFVDNSAVPWFIDRPVVWSPSRASTRKRICGYLHQPEARP